MSIIQGTSKSSAATFEIDQSIRFNDNDSAYLSRTPSSAGNRRTFTFSCWVKRANITSANCPILSAGGDEWLMFLSGDTLGFNQDGTNNYRIVTSQIFNDPGAWFHLVLRVDTTNSTAGDRFRLYINGSEVTDFGTDTNPPLNYETAINNTVEHDIGKLVGASQFFDGYLAEINHVDGSSLGPDSFGETNADTGQWVPKKYTGSYGSNGFRLQGSDSSDLGEDTSGNGNDFTSSGLAAADQRDDSPTLNKATLNPLDTGANQTLSDGNLTVTNGSGTGSLWNRSTATQGLTYKTYYEIHADNLGSLNMGLTPSGLNVHDTVNNPAGNIGCGIQNNEIFVQGSYASESSGSITFPIATGNYVMFAYDPDRNALWVGNEGTWKDGTGSSASSATILAEIEGSGTSYAIFTGIGSNPVPYIGQYSTSVATARFSSQEWEGTAPTGYEQLAPSVLPDPTIDDPSAYFQATTYTGDGSSSNEINQAGNSTFEPSMVWIKSRSAATDHVIQDQVRGNFIIYPNQSSAEGATGGGWVSSFDSDGFTVSSNAPLNDSGKTFVGWQWRAAGSGSSNTDGDITSTVSANTTSGVSVLTYSGNGSDNQTIGHGLGIAPKMIITKRRDSSGNWTTYHDAVGINKVFYLNSTAAPSSNTEQYRAVPTSSVYTVGVGGDINNSSGTYVAYVFAEVDGFSKIGSYEGNGSTDGPFIYTGFKPRFVIMKRYSSTESWPMLDTARGSGNFGSAAGTGGTDPTAGNDLNTVLVANTSAAEEDNPTGSRRASYLSNGFKVRTTNTAMNASGSDYLYMAFAESPFKHATAR